jgi:cellulose synthase/poly-beta-1,6-N-acetylglucosamine synthase-like glycosyltransferase
MSRIGVVVAGRNEGQRLRRCLESLVGQGFRVVYADSGSTDGSPELAAALGAEVVTTAPPHSAAKGRNAGFDRLMQGEAPDLVQFVDGDCEVEPGWLAAAAAAFATDAGLGLVTGWRSERDPCRNLFHALAETEWRRPAGPIRSCGGDMMVRAGAFRAAGGFDPGLVVAEDEEFCLRLAARTGLRLVRLPRPMTRHDIAMDGLGAWWRRHLRSGHGFAEVGRRHPPHFRREGLRAWGWGLALPLAAAGGALNGAWWIPALAALALGASWARTARGLARAGRPRPWGQAALLTLVKLPQAQGMIGFHLRRLGRRGPRLIEYK